ncbi:hypothetical protein [Nostoc sp.]
MPNNKRRLRNLAQADLEYAVQADVSWTGCAREPHTAATFFFAPIFALVSPTEIIYADITPNIRNLPA